MSDKVHFKRGRVQLYLQDMLEGVNKLPAKSFDLAIADPPYGASTSATWKLDKDHSLVVVQK
ncbi:MAG: hypothetical protein ACE5H9_04780 [Anaerolineae bacterium]